jgi:nicotinamide-nucleotide amidase
MLPENCHPVQNENGTAPGMWFEKDNVIYVSMPGVPFEMKPMMQDYVLPELKKRFVNQVIIHNTILTQGVGESFLAEKIEDWENNLPSHIKLAYLPQPGMVRLRLSATGNDSATLDAELEKIIAALREIVGDLIYGYDDDTLEGVVGKLLLGKNLSLSTAESCTGGYLAHRITSIPGSSGWYKGSIISYANEIKTAFLNVAESDLDTHGAVSEVVVRKMAESVRIKMGTDYSIATSGIAGPDGGTDDKPVGTTWVAVAGPTGTFAQKFSFGDGRDRNIHRSAIFALNLLRKALLGITSGKS